ncbi:MAG: metal-sulfur cluster assembly factor [Planctomycetota bacterium]
MSVSADEVRGALRDVLDPETGVNLVDLGLIYDVDVEQDGAVVVTMTLTTPACPAGDAIARGVVQRLQRVAGITAGRVVLTFDPPWTPERITAEGRRLLES